MFQVPLIVLLAVGVLWKSIDLARATYDRVLRILVASLSLLLVGEVLSIPGIIGSIDSATAVGVGKVAFNGIYISGLFALHLFFVFSVRGTRAAHDRRLRAEIALLVGVLIALVVSMAVTPAAMRGHSLSTPHMAEPAIASFYVIGNAYFIHAYLASGRWALRYARKAAQHFGYGLLIVALGLFGLALTSVNRMILVVLRIGEPGSHQELNTVNWSISNWAMGITLAGICYSASVQLFTRLRSVAHHRRMYRELTPLWTALTAAYPELVLDQPRAGFRWPRPYRYRTQEQRFYRRFIECRDGLVRLSPYLSRVAPGADLARAPADRLARYITEALALNSTAEPPYAGVSAVRVAIPVGGDLDADARELIAISRFLHERES
ncbi:hypothetical protein GCM10010387_54380 [Streptomyces inusitatus]|uniref:DUF6545 domain-containing protein n=1 Tax=Streptomyces inusitatus TaxID=68221 RepID=A0A918QLI4_9ACTN|nr:MAB_1171c family putative transporter [Streptomyces inusitatus]GGZ53321.1 hypothetical protein GCM10010387_54380 [Streptomyces inusitatus]